MQSRAAKYSPRPRLPFWLPASNYYILTSAISVAFFFVVWGISLDGGDEEAPGIWSGIAAGSVLGAAIFLREVVLRKIRRRYILNERKLDANLKRVPVQHQNPNVAANKLSIEKNAVIVKEIQQKSEAARISSKSTDAHLEVFEICGEYLALNRRQMETVGIGSPRLAALRRGREIVESLHRFHLLSWAQNQSRQLTQESKIRVTISDKLEAAQRALTVITSALEFYPNETELLESERALKEFAATIKVSHWIEQAERAAFKGNHKRAINHYRDALFFMARENLQSDERDLIAERINDEIERLRAISAKNLESKNRDINL